MIDFLMISTRSTKLYYAIGLDPIGLGDDLGFHIENGLINFGFSSLIKDDKPCIVLEYEVCKVGF